MMTAEELAALHAEAFAGQGRAWRAAEFAGLLAGPHVILCHRKGAFALGRVIADEAELLTIATAPEMRKQGLARCLLRELEQAGARRGATRLFLEVAEDNEAARALYTSAGFAETGRRKGYYARDDADPVDALLLEKPLSV
jgi:ribosomal-protein-alanine N-acetyltransferase